MRLSRTPWVPAFALLLALASAGCIENMGDLKEALGVVPPAPAAPVYLPPFAKMQADALAPLAGATVGFSAEGSRDPQGLPLTFSWDMGDGTVLEGARVEHAYASAGTFIPRLLVTNAAGLRDDDALTLRVAPLDRAPSAALRILDASGAPAARAAMHETLTFESAAADPEGKPLRLEWDFGDGATAAGERVTRAYAAPGAYDVRLSVTDVAGQSAATSARVLVDGAWRAQGAFQPAGASEADVAFHVPAGARLVTATLRFPANLGLHDLELVLLDAAGAEAARSAGAGAPGANGEAERAVVLDTGYLSSAAPGAWTARVAREAGLDVPWTLELKVAM